MTTTAEPATSPGAARAGATSLPALLLEQARTRGRAVAVREKELGRWRPHTWSEYAERAARIGLGLLELGVQPGDKVAIQADNRLEWLLADLGAQGIGAVTVGIYPTCPAAEVEYLLSHSESVVLVAEDEEQLDKALEVTKGAAPSGQKGAPSLRKIVVIDPRGVKNLDHPMLMTFAELEALGRERQLEEWEAAVGRIDPAGLAILVYTSGTTGPPKGAMLSHDNLLAAARAFQEHFEVTNTDEVLSYLPLCHVAERLISGVNAIASGYVVNFGEGGESFVTDLRDVQPTWFLGVPRVWEKMMAGVQIRMADASWIKRANYRFWVKRGAAVARARMKGRMGPLQRAVYLLGWLFLYRSLRMKLGLSRVRVAVSGAAPIAPQVLEFFWALGVPVREGYGQTENTAMATYTPKDDVRIGRVGRPLPQVELRIADDGEILTRSPGVFMGYFKDEETTRRTVDAEGWLHTGDVGVLDDDGFLTITDRKKDIIITAGGKNISPSEIENRLKISPFVREAIVIGDRRKYLTALIGIEFETVGNWATRRNIAYTTYHDLTTKPEVRQLIQEWVDEVNADLAQVETIKRFEFLPKELDPEEGELTATQKVKRAAIAREFGDLIEQMYQGAA